MLRSATVLASISSMGSSTVNSEALKVGAGKGKVGGVYVARGEPKDVCQLGQGAGYAASGFECAAKVEFFA